MAFSEAQVLIPTAAVKDAFSGPQLPLFLGVRETVPITALGPFR